MILLSSVISSLCFPSIDVSSWFSQYSRPLPYTTVSFEWLLNNEYWRKGWVTSTRPGKRKKIIICPPHDFQPSSFCDMMQQKMKLPSSCDPLPFGPLSCQASIVAAAFSSRHGRPEVRSTNIHRYSKVKMRRSQCRSTLRIQGRRVKRWQLWQCSQPALQFDNLSRLLARARAGTAAHTRTHARSHAHVHTHINEQIAGGLSIVYHPFLVTILVIFGGRALIFFCLKALGKIWKMTPLLYACAVVITLETQKGRKRATSLRRI